MTWDINYTNQHERFRSDTDRLLKTLSTWFRLKESETTVCLKTFEKKIGLYCNVRLLLPQSFHAWKNTKMAGWTYKAIISNKQNLLEATCWERTVACYLVKFYTVHVIAAKLAIRTLHFVTIFSTELKYDEEKITQLTNWCRQLPDLLLSKDYFSSQFLFFPNLLFQYIANTVHYSVGTFACFQTVQEIPWVIRQSKRVLNIS